MLTTIFNSLLVAASSMGLASAPVPPDADRQAILAMAGEYAVTFSFDETVVLTDGDYARMEPHRSGAREVVLVIEDAPTRIVLQHILVAPNGHVTKHWRQDWHFEAAERLEFVADQLWEVRPIGPELVEGSWTQCVYGVADAPRYCGTGHWNHRYGVATWTSDRGWRPLPRRDLTVRDDYNALNVENRHTVTAHGWTHEQDNTKVVRHTDQEGVSLVVREFGFNDYLHTTEADFSPAHEYWDATEAFWALVRSEWATAEATGSIRLDMPIDGMPLIMELFELAEVARQGNPVAPARIRESFDRHMVPGEMPLEP